MPSPLTRTVASGILVASLASAQAHARVGQICLELPAGASVVKAEIDSGCLPTSPGYEGDFEVTVDAKTATIAINGSYQPVGDQRIATADCMGSQVITQQAEAAGPRRYSVLVNGAYRGVIDATKTMQGFRAAQSCFADPSQVPIPSPDTMTTYHMWQFKDWISETSPAPGKRVKPVPKTLRAETLSTLAANLQGTHPESLEGRPSVRVTISPAQWQARPWDRSRGLDTRFMAIQIEEHGFADDSVSGRRTFASAKQEKTTGQWRARRVWRQYMCARGERAGQWTNQPCP
ncbi:MAG: hypothetical protein HRT64_12225 [Erythrobacter sp.]|nr:hypothetical protein [Erythrobacter sp.]